MTEGSVRPLWALRTVVTGGAGFLGGWLCERLLELGAHVQCVDDHSAAASPAVARLDGHPRFTAVRTDLCEGLPVDGAVDWVLHLAWPGAADPKQMTLGSMQLGCVGTQRALDLATAHDARFLLVCPARAQDEPGSFVEALSEAYRGSLGVDTGVARVFGAFGPGMPLHEGDEVGRLVQQALAGVPLTVRGDGSRRLSLCYVADAVGGLLVMAASPAPGPVDLAGAQVTELELAQAVLRVSGSTSAVQLGAVPDGPAAGLPDPSSAERLLGWYPAVDVAEGLARTVRWARALAP